MPGVMQQKSPVEDGANVSNYIVEAYAAFDAGSRVGSGAGPQM